MSSQPGWYEFHAMPVNTTHIAYLYEDGSVYLPELISILEWNWAVDSGRAHRLVREDEALAAAADLVEERDMLRAERAAVHAALRNTDLTLVRAVEAALRILEPEAT